MPTDRDRRIHRIVNPLFMAISGRRFRSYCVIKHCGRKSGREYANPVTAFPLGDGFVIAVLYGNDSNWVRNVMVTGRCVLRTKGEDHVLDRPEIITAAQALPAYSKFQRRLLARKGINEFVWAHRPAAVGDGSTERSTATG